MLINKHIERSQTQNDFFANLLHLLALKKINALKKDELSFFSVPYSLFWGKKIYTPDIYVSMGIQIPTFYPSSFLPPFCLSALLALFAPCLIPPFLLWRCSGLFLPVIGPTKGDSGIGFVIRATAGLHQ